ncbi:hypothetical protein AB835_04645 [Candidatus Endobugula sertula]|uniref:Baseplate J-like central domain-containing protein n=1 Tax=Candidatus Endobugula sertula TaxID=62101 RepID=A0A1D2QRG1_9GAMM|nr:hypothetical protein AB835_04645 [Candidatus Endobugula sertula]
MLSTSQLANADVLQVKTFEAILAKLLTIVDGLVPDYQPLESDPYMLLTEAYSWRELHLRKEFNNKLKSLLLHFAKGNNLDLIGNDRYNVERLDGEKDEPYLDRILASLDGYSTAGSLESYEYHARSVSAIIDDAKAVSPEKGVIDVYIASYDNDITDELVNQVINAVSAKKVRPITDEVHVKIATPKLVTIDAAIELEDINTQEAAQSEIENNFAGTFKIHQALPFSDVMTKLKVTGVYDALPTAPTQTVKCETGERIVIEAFNLSFTQAESEGV